jgi:hypothetical protein
VHINSVHVIGVVVELPSQAFLCIYNSLREGVPEGLVEIEKGIRELLHLVSASAVHGSFFICQVRVLTVFSWLLDLKSKVSQHLHMWCHVAYQCPSPCGLHCLGDAGLHVMEGV